MSLGPGEKLFRASVRACVERGSVDLADMRVCL